MYAVYWTIARMNLDIYIDFKHLNTPRRIDCVLDLVT